MLRTWWNPRRARTRRAVRPPRCRLLVEQLEDRRVLSTVFGLSTTNQLVTFDSAAPTVFASTTPILGLQIGENILGIDFRPLTGQLYGLGSSGRLYTINTATGQATQVGTGTFAVALNGTDFGFDFNPVPDRIRVVSDAEQNMRLNPDTGAVVDGDPNMDGIQADPNLNPAGNVVAVAYTNNFAGAANTTLFGIDSGSDMLVMIGGPAGNPSPNLGAVTNVGALGVNTSGLAGFDITANDNLAFASLTVNNVPQLYRINLASGVATLVGNIGNGQTQIRDIAVQSRAVTLFAITAGATPSLIRFNSATPGTLIGTPVAITGLQTGETIVGADFRPANGMLYAVGSTSRLYTIDTTSGAATQVGTGTFDPPLNGTSFGVDFNPVPDRLRVISDAEQNLRLNPDTGMVADFDPNTPGTQPDANLNPAGTIVAGAYTNNVAGATATTLYGIDTGSDMLVRIGGLNGNPSPNNGQVTNGGALGVAADQAQFDIAAADGTAFAAMLVMGVTNLYTIDLTTGAATLVGPIGDGTQQLVALSAPTAGQVAFSMANFTVAENAGTATITINRTGGSEGPVTVNFATANGSAQTGSDFTGVSMTLTFAAGETTRTVTIPILNDATTEPDETVMLRLTNPTGGVALGMQATATLTITNDDVPPVSGNQAFVNELYTDLLGRPADAPTLAALTSRLDAGTATRFDVALGVQNSDEFRTRAVQRLYMDFLNRAADPAGLSVGMSFLASGGSLDQLRSFLLGSDEYFQTQGGGTNQGFLNALYQDALGRPIDPAALAALSQQLASGVTRAQIALGVVQSAEADAFVSQFYYQSLLDRAADPSGLNASVSALQAGTPEAVLVASIASSDEYFAGAQS